ncbi:BZ3500_MvSof-1268-A1-R1_Chr6-1g08364 [Microbotryum saponariae]|uniref:BZ3500_MvSof-1268-A1-R1_Chr6-1g08364 protein n=1 Tax=Microbotryum saponariae TaxID=289078 RepID=A0A2X0LQE0_9BASI|nr:BZ3500_MvSof-1268-A1-R1_Chr6-1g08364 [Microbotryum saponariae]SDA07648.1 BZ3501_MvSof-1269-A2-R1_Chr6-1g08085 [Microbotryum saponariae]
MQVNGVPIGGDDADAIVNSGTVYMVMRPRCTRATPPVFTDSFPGGSTVWTISKDTFNLGQVDDTNCLASVMGGAQWPRWGGGAAGGAGHILGDAFMQNLYTTFKSNNARVGFPD